jgi:hypothetical protein
MQRILVPRVLLLLVAASHSALAIQTPTNVVSLTGDQSVVLHWDPVMNASLAGYRVYRSTTGSGGPFALQTTTLLTIPGFCDVSSFVINGKTNFYYVTAVDSSTNESPPSVMMAAVPEPFASTNAFLDYVQQTSFDYFWYSANPANGLIPDRSPTSSACSIAAVGFGLTAIGIGVDHGWITRTQAVTRVLTTLNTFLNGPQGTNASGVIGYQGWFYHFLDMNTALRSNSELSSIDTVLLLGGILYAKQYFNGTNADETSIRAAADAIFNGVNWTFFAQGTDQVAMGWQPGSGFSGFGNWVGYDEAMILYVLGLGTATNPLPATAWSKWTSGYIWGSVWGQTYVEFPSMYGHQYSHCWIDFRHIADTFMNSHNTTYFENARRAALSQVAYCSTAPHTAYSSTVWGLTACDGPGFSPYAGYAFRGIPNTLISAVDDGTIAPTAAGASMPFAPEYSVPTLQAFYTRFRFHIWTSYGFRDAFNIGAGWYDTDDLGIDEGPIVIMIENYRTQRVWQLFMQNAEVQRGLQRAGFVSLPFVALQPQTVPAQGAFELAWNASASRYYQVEYSPDMSTWAASPGFVEATNTGTFDWLDTGPPVTVSAPTNTPQRFYRVFQLGSP